MYVTDILHNTISHSYMCTLTAALADSQLKNDFIYSFTANLIKQQ